MLTPTGVWLMGSVARDLGLAIHDATAVMPDGAMRTMARGRADSVHGSCRGANGPATPPRRPGSRSPARHPGADAADRHGRPRKGDILRFRHRRSTGEFAKKKNVPFSLMLGYSNNTVWIRIQPDLLR
jgi:hypothetical protein